LFEGETTDHAIEMDVTGNVKEIPLGFTIRCDKFTVDFYPNGAPKLFRSDLTIIDNGKVATSKSILVNDPLTYKGITFYQSSYQTISDVRIKVVSPAGKQDIVTVSNFDKTILPGTGLILGLLKYLPDVHGAPAARIYIGEPSGRGEAIWLLQGHTKDYEYGDREYRIALEGVDERYMTGLQVKKDPGVWMVWLGCFAMVTGFGIVFWVPHQRLWLWIGEDKDKARVILAGQTSKNKASFEKLFKRLENAIGQTTGEI
jgi:cytochrome c biogenesis protein